MNLEDLANFARNNNASDIHLSTGHPPMLRVLGDMLPMRLPGLEAQEVAALLHDMMSEAQRVVYQNEKEIDFAIHLSENSRFRVNAFTTLRGPAAVLRTIPTTVKTLAELELPPIIEQLCSLQRGLILVTGATGSGKSTTVAAIINHINVHYPKHIITLEDPVEFVHKSSLSLINHREIGIHTASYARALKSALRENPDIIVIGELRDIETIHAALTAAETGHLVIATLHTSSAAQTIDRVIDVFSSEEKAMIRTMFSNALEAVIAQCLLRTHDGLRRVSAFEILIATPAVRNLIREGKIAQINSLIQVGSSHGMISMQDSVMKLLKAGIISKEVAGVALNQGGEKSPMEEISKDSKGDGGLF